MLDVSLSHFLAAKSIFDRLGIEQSNEDENSGDPQLLAQPVDQQPRLAAPALPFAGNLRPEALLPIIMQPRLIPVAATTAP